MKRIVAILLVVSMVAAANAGLTVVIQDDVGGWLSYEDSKFTITPSTEIVWGVMDDGLTDSGLYVLGIVGPGSITAPTVVANGVTAALLDDAVTAAEFGVQNPYISMD